MTSNAGAQSIVEPKRLGFSAGDDEKADYERMKSGVMSEVRRIFKPEFLNRIDDIILFSPLTKDQIKGIIRLSFNDIAERLKNKDIALEVTDRALEFIADEAYDPHYGARPIKRDMTKHVETAIAGDIIRGNIVDGQKVICDAENGKLVFRTAEAEA